MYLEAVSIGYAVPPRDFVACIHSVFRTSVNLQPEGGSVLLTLTTSNQADLPQGIRLETPEGLNFDNLRPGQHVYCRDGILSFQTAPLRVDLRKARNWRCDLSALNIKMTDPVTAFAWNYIWQELNKRQIDAKAEIVARELFQANEEVKTIAAWKASQAMHNLLQATCHYDPAAIQAAGELIGLGTGLTPSGDDLLVGYLAGLWSTAQGKNNQRRFVAKLGRAIIDLSWGTNDISHTYLFHAAQGQVASHLVALVQAISRVDDTKHLLEIAETAMQVGHTSGMDTVTGLLLGLIAWTYPRTFEALLKNYEHLSNL